MTVAVFVVTVMNFLLSSLNTGSQVATLIVLIRNALTVDINHPLPEKQKSVNNALRTGNTIAFWAETLPVSIKLSIPILYLFLLGRDIAQ